MKKLICLEILVLLAGGCDDQPMTTPPDMAPEPFAVVVSRDSMGMSGSVNTVTLGSRTATRAIDTTLDGDSLVRRLGGKAYVLSRGKSTLRVYDDRTWATPLEGRTGDAMFPAGFSAGPQDLMPVPGTSKVYISFFGNDGAHELGVMDAGNPSAGVTKWIALSAAAADGDGKPEASELYYCGGKLYVSLDDISSTTFAPTGPGRIAVVDTATDMVLGVIQLRAQNPGYMSGEGAGCKRALVAAAGPFGIEPNDTSGIERVDLEAMTSLETLFTGAQLMASPAEIQVASASLAFATVFYDLQDAPGGGYKILSSSRVIAFDPSQKRVLGDVSDKAGYIGFMRLSPEGSLWFGVNVLSTVDNTGKLKGGLYIGKGDGTKLSSMPISLGQDPYSIAFE